MNPGVATSFSINLLSPHSYPPLGEKLGDLASASGLRSASQCCPDGDFAFFISATFLVGILVNLLLFIQL